MLPKLQNKEGELNMGNDIFGNAKKLGFGLMRLPLHNPAANDADIDIEEYERMVDAFIERGFTYFDTALMYCGSASEAATKTALVDRHERSTFTLTDKLHYAYLKTEADCDRILGEQLERTGAGYFDYYLIHDINTESIEIYERLHVFDWILAKKAEGRVHHVGFSFHDSPELLTRVLTEHPEMEFVQLQLNYLDYDNPAIQSRRNYETATAFGKPIIVMEPIKGGTLINLPEEVLKLYRDYAPEASAASWAVRFAGSHSQVRMVLSGMSSLAQLDDNTSYMADFKPLNEEEQKIVIKAVEELKNSTAIPCTGCSYCTGGCPMQIPIPKYFGLYNGQKREDPEGKKGWTPQVEYYHNMTLDHSKAGDCIKCGQCESMCPQHLQIISLLETVAAEFEK